MSRIDPSRRPVTSYRLQFNRDFGFADARDLVPYLAGLGVSECYCSPYLKANPGSRHGYDICEHGTLNPELGSAADYDSFCAALQAHGLGHIVDIVPNHMAADPKSNPWWRDVLENGPSSPFAEFFDIDWDPVKPELKGKVLLPVLGDQYGRVLERGELQLHLEDGALRLRYFDLDLPINPRQAPRVFRLHLDRLEQEMTGDPALREYLSVLTALHNLPVYTERDPDRIAERQREKEVARERLSRLVAESPAIRCHVDGCVRQANGVPGQPASFDVLHDLLENQAYRLAYWWYHSLPKIGRCRSDPTHGGRVGSSSPQPSAPPAIVTLLPANGARRLGPTIPPCPSPRHCGPVPLHCSGRLPVKR